MKTLSQEEALELLRGGPEGISEWNRRRDAGVEIPSLQNVDLSGITLAGVNLSHATLILANLNSTRIVGADFHGADLTRAQMLQAHVIRTDFHDAVFKRAMLIDTTVRGGRFDGADFEAAQVGHIVVACDLSGAKHLEIVRYMTPSEISIRAILCFNEDPPEEFLWGFGLTAEDVACLREQVGRAGRFYSCFICYSTADEAFATRLHNDFQAAGIRCWKWDHDARTGKSLWGEIDQAIRDREKLVLIASESSLKSPAVNREIERALQQEDSRFKRKQAGELEGDVDVLFPVRLDDFVLEGWEHERKADVIKKVITDARGWEKDEAIYRRVRDKLIADLKPT